MTKYFGAHKFQAREEVIKISSERGYGLVFAVFFAPLGALSAVCCCTRNFKNQF